MYLCHSSKRALTYSRVQVPKRTTAPPLVQHPLEKVLAWRGLRPLLRHLTRTGRAGSTLFERICENYDRSFDSRWQRYKWFLPTRLIDAILRRTGANKKVLKEKLFHHPPTVRALALTARSIGVYGLTVPQRFTAPLFVVWNITQACNLRCQHCYQNATARPSPTELSTPEKLSVVDELASKLVPFLAIAGGEPLVAPDLLDVVARCQARRIHVTLATNGTLLTPEKCRDLRRAGVRYVEVSLDSPDPQEHDRFRGQPGAFHRSVQGIRNAIKAGIRTSLACCFTRHNVHMAERMVQFAIELGCNTFSHFNFIPVGRARQVAEYDLLPEQREHLLSVLRRFLVEGKIAIISTAPQFGRDCIMAGFDDGVFVTGHAGHGRGTKTMVLTRYLGGCGAGRCYCSIQPDGAVTPCVYMPDLKVGDLRRQPLSEIWNNRLADVLADRDDRGDHCGVCDYRHYCGGCRARALAYTSDLQAGDPGCVFNIHEWQEVNKSIQCQAASAEMISSRSPGQIRHLQQLETEQRGMTS